MVFIAAAKYLIARGSKRRQLFDFTPPVSILKPLHAWKATSSSTIRHTNCSSAHASPMTQAWRLPPGWQSAIRTFL